MRQLHEKKAPLFPVEEWHIREDRPDVRITNLAETIFSQANGYIGTRGTFEEGSANLASCEGMYINGVYLREPYEYPESAYAFATHNNKMIQVPNGKSVRLEIDGETLLCGASAISNYQRCLDLRTGMLERSFRWVTASGKELDVAIRRIVSLADKNLFCLEYTLTAVNFDGSVRIASSLDAAYRSGNYDEDDPRVGKFSIKQSLHQVETSAQDRDAVFVHHVRSGGFAIVSSCRHVFTQGEPVNTEVMNVPGQAGFFFTCDLQKGKSHQFVKYVAYHHGHPGEEEALKEAARQTLNVAETGGFSNILLEQELILKEFWKNSDIVLDGDPGLQQGLRYNMFSLYQSAGRDGRSNIAAKGLSGPGYDGHYFWDTEIYIIPFFVYGNPVVARKLLEYRYSILDAARERARQMSHVKGALYAWRTIGGEECSAYYAAGTAQYHINAAVAYAIRQYFQATEDWDFMLNYGAEMLFETARIWLQLGHFNPRKEGRFCIYSVTGPDEYTAVVNNNFYTNAMAQCHLRTAVEIAEKLRKEDAAAFTALKQKIGLEEIEIADWKKVAETMYLPYDEKLGINPQDDAFLERPRWDFANTPEENYPLLLHYHPLVIYRYQVLKQADTVLAMVLLGDQFTSDLKRRNLEFYEPLTTHDSTLSTCMYSIASAEAGKFEEAYNFFEDSVRMDLDNNHGNTEYGLHMACMAGSWMSVVKGFGGMRVWNNMLRFAPYLPRQWKGYTFRVFYRGSRIEVSVSPESVSYNLLEGPSIEILHGEQKLALQPGKQAMMSLSSEPERKQA
ncbi:MAG: glycosyl hydrolase family 65 protein [Rickettsiales bacterium]